MNWCFGIVNGRLAEVFFDTYKDDRKHIFAHAYVRKEEYKTKKERKMIAEDTAHVHLSYRNKHYKLLPS